MRLAPELKSKIDTRWDKFWSGGLSNPLSSIEQMSYLIFMKRLEDMDAAEQKKALAKKKPFNSILKTAGKNGQFRTPRHIIGMIVGLVDPDIGDRICDPAFGTAGFLINAYEHIIRKHTGPDMVCEDDEGQYYGLYGDKITDKKAWVILWGSFCGFDFDSTMVKISLMNMVLHSIATPRITLTDTLSKRFTQENKYTIVPANPPFKGSIDKGDINDHLTVGTTKTELLFVERMMNLLQIGGKCGVIVPDGVLFGTSNAHKKLRQLLLEKCQLEAVISMPPGVFKPYAGVSTAVLVFIKGDKTGKVWFYDMEADGFSLDDKRNFIDGKGDIPDIIHMFRKRFEENPVDRKGKCFFVPVSEIKENGYDLSISKYKEIEHEKVAYEKPEVIMEKIEALEDKIKTNITELKEMLGRT